MEQPSEAEQPSKAEQPPKPTAEPESEPESEPKEDPVMAIIQKAKNTYETFTEGLKSMNVRETCQKASKVSDWLLILDSSDMINDMRTKTNVARAAIRDVRNGTLDEPTTKILDEVDQGFDNLLTRIEGLRACIDEWMEGMRIDARP
ncbi:hypothetical protein LX32DRAFT_647909 [Colletotrichum zoysiae]|uniref:Uncharacterized protein n=1 Tax=Colletotrichum zoysiae TaxID=1216348 RepID=A0AAD9HTR8_9PEZI|nr:hypothetical protein LX32DRAFT_647909 [Colletotrichum zoysiae]